MHEILLRKFSIVQKTADRLAGRYLVFTSNSAVFIVNAFRLISMYAALVHFLFLDKLFLKY